MSEKPVVIRFQSFDAWDVHREAVDKIIEEFTGTLDFPSTKSLPPIIFGVILPEDGIGRLRDLDGVIVDIHDDDG
ncbi:hypothetical protein BJX61DRAFT_491345 [Aspergillus egyptiacus]|nr:hypothetical protein BJX61DRAFT_491345 [Aspergillus egyptiacus]